MLYLYYEKFKFQNGQPTEITRELWHHMAHSNTPSLTLLVGLSIYLCFCLVYEF